MRLGNALVVHEGQVRPDLGRQVTTVHFAPGVGEGEAVAHVLDLWSSHSPVPPAWVDGAFSAAVAAHFSCPVGIPDDWT